MSEGKKTLEDVYFERMTTEPVGLKEFMEEVVRGRYGEFTKDEIKSFLLEIEQVYIENIYLKSQEVPFLQDQVDERIEETRTMIQELIDQFAS